MGSRDWHRPTDCSAILSCIYEYIDRYDIQYVLHSHLSPFIGWAFCFLASCFSFSFFHKTWRLHIFVTVKRRKGDSGCRLGGRKPGGCLPVCPSDLSVSRFVASFLLSLSSHHSLALAAAHSLPACLMPACLPAILTCGRGSAAARRKIPRTLQGCILALHSTDGCSHECAMAKMLDLGRCPHALMSKGCSNAASCSRIENPFSTHS